MSKRITEKDMSDQVVKIEAEEWYSECPISSITSVFLTKSNKLGITVSDNYPTDGSDLIIDMQALIQVLEHSPELVSLEILEYVTLSQLSKNFHEFVEEGVK